MLGVVLAIVLTTASAVNARYGYLPTLATVFGRTATDQVSAARLRALEAANNPVLGGGGRSVGSSRGGARPAVAMLERGVVVPFPMPGRRSHFHARTGEVYLPPAYFESPRPVLPVIELLHGTPGSPADWTRGAFADVTSDEYASRARWARAGARDARRERRLDQGLRVRRRQARERADVPHGRRAAGCDRPLPYATRRVGWAIAGLSEGGFCALQIGLRHPNLYGTIADFSGETGPIGPRRSDAPVLRTLPRR